MTIAGVEAIPVTTPLRMAGATVRSRTCVIVRLRTTDGLTGVGEGVIAPYFTGETLGSAVHLVEALYRPLLVGADPFDVHALGRQLDRVAHGNSATRSAVDIALHDLIGRALGVPLYRLFGGRVRDEVQTVHHVSNMDPTRDAAEAAEAAADGFGLIKVKVGVGPVDRDVPASTRCARPLAMTCTCSPTRTRVGMSAMPSASPAVSSRRTRCCSSSLWRATTCWGWRRSGAARRSSSPQTKA
jgi:L-alanine-DL-glutamate epimerase-like enolase superfamily enzyme